MGVVFLARDRDLARPVAIKLVAPRERTTDGRQRLLREAKAAAGINHPNVVIVHQGGVWNDQVFIVMEYVDGGTLREWIKSSRPAWPDILDALRQAAAGLAAAHAAGLVHRDFKPDNVLIGKDGRVRVSDFGLVSVSGSVMEATMGETLGSSDVALTQTGALLGTPAYMAPEQFAGASVDARADQFAFGVALFEALYGMRPFEGTTPASQLYAVAQGQIVEPPPSEVPVAVHRAIVKALAANPDARHASMNAMLRELRWDPKAKRRRATTIAASVAGVALVGAIGGGLAVIRPWHNPSAGDDALVAAIPDCEAQGATIAETWNDTRRAELRELFVDAGPHSEQAFAQLDVTVSEYTARWSTMRVEVCTAAWIDKTQSEEERLLRTFCLKDRRTELDVFLGALRDAQADVRVGVVGALTRLRPLEQCADLGTLRSLPTRPDAATQKAIEGNQRERAHAMFLLGAGKYVAGLEAAMRALAGARELADPSTLARALVLSANANLELARAGPAERLANEAVEVAAPLREHNVEADAVLVLFAASYGLGKYAEAKAMLGSVQAAVARAGRPERKALVLFHEANLAYFLGDSAAAIEKSTAGITMYAEGGLRSELRLARLHIVRAGAQASAKSYAAAAKDYTTARSLLAMSVGEHNSDLGAIALGTAAVFYLQGEQSRALPGYEKAAALYLSVDQWHPNAMVSLQSIGGIHFTTGNTEEELKALVQALKIGTHVYGEAGPMLYNITQRLGRIAWKQGRWEAAGRHYARGNHIATSDTWPDRFGAVTYDFQQAELAQSQGKFAESLPHIKLGLKRSIEIGGRNGAAARIAEVFLGDTYAHLGRCDEAKRHIAVAESIAAQNRWGNDLNTVQGLVVRTRCLLIDDDIAAASAKINAARTLVATLQQPGAMRPYTDSVYADVLWALGRDAEANMAANAAIEAFAALGLGYKIYADNVRAAIATHASGPEGNPRDPEDDAALP
ncbi:MAG: serine/threonine protein kinase [Nannocystaceae bacterium]|nr:serine/threonine protein kinase [Nannocystaceae bacterium]